MGNKFIAVQEASDVFAHSMQRHKKWFETVYISHLLEIDGALYRVVCTLSRFNKQNLRKVVICSDQGEVIQSEKLTAEIVNVVVYLHYLQVFADNMAFDAQQSGDSNFMSVITSLTKIYSELNEALSNSERAIINEQLTYYKETKQALDDLASWSKKSLELIKMLENYTVDDVLTSDFIAQLHDKIIRRGELRGNVEAHILKNGIKNRQSLIEILNDKKYAKHMSDNKDKLRVIHEAENAEGISNSIIKKGKTDWKFYEKWLGTNKGKFTIEKFISDFPYENEAKLFIQSNVNIIIKEHWIYSPNLKY